jgi:transposase
MTKQRNYYSPDQKREYAKLMVEEGYTNVAVQELSGASNSAISRWKRQYVAEKSGVTPKATALSPEHRRIQELEKQLRRAKRDNDILKKAAAFFIQDNPCLK